MLYAVRSQRGGQSEASEEPGSAILERTVNRSLTNPRAIMVYDSVCEQCIDVKAKTHGEALFSR
ncbi:leucine efflux protein LeuE, partial [Klebsiella pneumoniae]